MVGHDDHVAPVIEAAGRQLQSRPSGTEDRGATRAWSKQWLGRHLGEVAGRLVGIHEPVVVVLRVVETVDEPVSDLWGRAGRAEQLEYVRRWWREQRVGPAADVLCLVPVALEEVRSMNPRS
jgi:hypothetical protein